MDELGADNHAVKSNPFRVNHLTFLRVEYQSKPFPFETTDTTLFINILIYYINNSYVFIYYLFVFFFALRTKSPKALNIKTEIYVWNGHGAASEIM